MTASSGYSDDLAFALHLADLADKISLERFRAGDLDISTKPDRSHVTDADLAVERALREAILRDRPGDGILGEEYGTEGATTRQWILDPIDGTANFLRGVPNWATLISLAENGVPRVGVASAPAFNRRWWAAPGAGAWLSENSAAPRRIRVSAVEKLEDASLSFQSIAQWRDSGHLPQLLELSERVWRERAYGDMWSYGLLAEGLVDIVAEFDVKEYDIAPFVAIITEAGGKFTAFDGSESISQRSSLATNGLLHGQVLDVTQP